jgi:hypothetical protein
LSSTTPVAGLYCATAACCDNQRAALELAPPLRLQNVAVFRVNATYAPIRYFRGAHLFVQFEPLERHHVAWVRNLRKEGKLGEIHCRNGRGRGGLKLGRTRSLSLRSRCGRRSSHKRGSGGCPFDYAPPFLRLSLFEGQHGSRYTGRTQAPSRLPLKRSVTDDESDAALYRGECQRE